MTGHSRPGAEEIALIKTDSDSDHDGETFSDEEEDDYVTIAKLHDGSAFGELALISLKPRMATVRALKTT
jgi:CRP-like cAMP-binding protein